MTTLTKFRAVGFLDFAGSLEVSNTCSQALRAMVCEVHQSKRIPCSLALFTDIGLTYDPLSVVQDAKSGNLKAKSSTVARKISRASQRQFRTRLHIDQDNIVSSVQGIKQGQGMSMKSYFPSLTSLCVLYLVPNQDPYRLLSDSWDKVVIRSCLVLNNGGPRVACI